MPRIIVPVTESGAVIFGIVVGALALCACVSCCCAMLCAALESSSRAQGDARASGALAVVLDAVVEGEGEGAGKVLSCNSACAPLEASATLSLRVVIDAQSPEAKAEALRTILPADLTYVCEEGGALHVRFSAVVPAQLPFSFSVPGVAAPAAGGSLAAWHCELRSCSGQGSVLHSKRLIVLPTQRGVSRGERVDIALSNPLYLPQN